MTTYLRSQLAKMADINSETLRYYEKNGLLPEPLRTDSGYRLYSKETLDRIEFIKMAKHCGFTLNQIKRLLSKADKKIVNINYFTDVIQARIKNIDTKIIELVKLKDQLTNLKDDLLEDDKSTKVKGIMHVLNIE
jgi:DNA-binding transcriptional MerR regulator